MPRSETLNTIDDADLGYLKEGRGNLDRGYSDELPAGARTGRTNNNGDTALDYETGGRGGDGSVYPTMCGEGSFEDYASERMMGGFIERPGLSGSDWGKAGVKRN